MKKRNIRIMDMHLELKMCIQRNSAKIAGNQPLIDAAATLTSRIALEQQLEQEIETILKGFARNKKAARIIMANLTNAMRRRIQASYAANNDIVSFNNANVVYSMLAYGAYNTSISRASNIYNMANALSPADKASYQVTIQNLAELNTAIENCTSFITSVRSAILLKQNAGANLKDAIRQTTIFIHDTMDSLMGAYSVTDQSFWNEWLLARTIINPSSSHAQITGSVVDAGSNSPLQRVKVKATNGIKVYEDITNRSGHYKIPVSPELYNITFELPDYLEQDKTAVMVDAGERETINIKLVKANIN